MSFDSRFRIMITVCSTVVAMCGASGVRGAMDPRFELDPLALDGGKSAAKPHAGERRSATSRSSRSSEKGSGGTTYTVRQGDHLFRILMRDYGLNNDEAEAFIEEIRRVNNIYDIKRLRVGQKITIPPVRRRGDGSLKVAKSAGVAAATEPVSVGQTLRLEAPAQHAAEETLARVKTVWEKLVPAGEASQKPLTLQSSSFSLTLDPQRYPVFSTLDGAKIIVDQGATIPPLVRSLISEKDPSVRIVSEPPADSRRFLGAMLDSAGFYSVEENFGMQFGTDPKLMVHADYKVEKTADSVIKQDVVLMSGSRTPLPLPLQSFLKKEGFTFLEPFATPKPFVGRTPLRQIHQISSKGQNDIADSILKALAINYTSDRRLDVFAADNNGISLSVKAERYFERDGQRFVVTRFDGDPITYTLFRILEAKGYRVAILEGQDDFRKVAEKLLSRLNIRGSFAQHALWDDDTSYTVHLSGFKLEGAGLPGGSVFLTDRELDRIIRDLLVENGYQITTK